MKTSRKTLKYRARKALLGRYPAAVGMVLIIGIASVLLAVLAEITMMISVIAAQGAMGAKGLIAAAAVSLFFGILLLAMFYGTLLPGIIRFYLNLCLGRKAGVLDMLWGIQYYGGKFFGISLIIGLALGVLALPVFVLSGAGAVTGQWEFPAAFLLLYGIFLEAAGIYVSLTYSLFYLILADEPEKTLTQALRESRQLMKGNRGRLFMLSLSFLGWIAIAWITMGLGFLWLIPYMSCTYCCFYLDLKENAGSRKYWA